MYILVPDCKKKWSLLRDAYRKAIKNRQTRSGQANVPIKKWKFEDLMSFLVPIFAERNQKSNLPEHSQNLYDAINVDTENIENIDSASTEKSILSPSSVSSRHPLSPISEPQSEPISPSTRSQPISPSTRSQALPKKTQRQPPPAVSEVLEQYLGDRKRSKVEKNASDHLKKFFESMEETVRTFPPGLQIEVKSRIYNLVSEYEYRNLRMEENRHQQWQRTESNQQLPPPVFSLRASPCQTGDSTNTLQPIIYQSPDDESAIPGTSHQYEEQNIARSYDCYLPGPSQ